MQSAIGGCAHARPHNELACAQAAVIERGRLPIIVYRAVLPCVCIIYQPGSLHKPFIAPNRIAADAGGWIGQHVVR